MSVAGTGVSEALSEVLVSSLSMKPPDSLPRLAAQQVSAERCTHEQLFQIVIEDGTRFRRGKELVQAHRDHIMRLKTEIFGVSFGAKGKKVLVTDESLGPQGKKMRWNEFCQMFFGITADWLARLLHEPKKKRKKPEKPAHLTQLEYRLLGCAVTVHEALVSINAGRVPEAVAKLKQNLPTKNAIAEHLERGVAPTILNPGGCTEPDPDIGEGSIVPNADSKTFKDWENHKLPDATGYELKYFAAAHTFFVHDFNHIFDHVPIRKALAMLKGDSAKLQERSGEFTRLALSSAPAPTNSRFSPT